VTDMTSFMTSYVTHVSPLHPRRFRSLFISSPSLYPFFSRTVHFLFSLHYYLAFFRSLVFGLVQGLRVFLSGLFANTGVQVRSVFSAFSFLCSRSETLHRRQGATMSTIVNYIRRSFQGTNLEIFKFGMYLSFPIGYMYYFGTNLENRFSVPGFWPSQEQSHKIPYEREEIRAEVERIQQDIKGREVERRRRTEDALSGAKLAFRDQTDDKGRA